MLGLKKPATPVAKPEAKPQWAQTKLKKGKGEEGEEAEKKKGRPAWSSRGQLKKSEKAGGGEEEPAKRRKDWRGGLKKSDT